MALNCITFFEGHEKTLTCYIGVIACFCSLQTGEINYPKLGWYATTTVSQLPGQVTITALSPAVVSEGTVVTISGTNFGTYASLITVLFNGKIAPIQSITATEIKVKVSPTTSGNVSILTSSGQTFTGPAFTYISSPILIDPYVTGDVTIATQADLDAFVAVNKGKELQINGNLNIGSISIPNSDITSVAGLSNITAVSGTITFYSIKITDASFLKTIITAGGITIQSCGFTTLSFNNLKSFSGNLHLDFLSNLTSVSFNGLTTVNELSIIGCSLLTDVSFLNNVISAGSIIMASLGNTTITVVPNT